MTRTRRDYIVFLFGVIVMGLTTWALTISAFFYVFKGEASAIIWMTINLLATAVNLNTALYNLRLRRIDRLIDLTDEALLEHERNPTLENAQRVIDLNDDCHAVVEKYFPHWIRK